MRKKLLDKFIAFLQKYQQSAVDSNHPQSQQYNSLSPIGDVEEKEYTDALHWALYYRKEKDIKNVALTGPYGSGKSSILKTFQHQYAGKFKFLNLSLATFKEELKTLQKKGKNTKEIRDQNKDLLRLIELSILQQIFYHEKDSKIPDSRFKKIRSFKKGYLLGIATSILIVLLCAFDLFASQKFYTFFDLSLTQDKRSFLHYLSLGIFILGLFFIIYRSIRLINSVKVSKLKFQDAEIEIDEGISKSILNNHLDEILYFFEVTPYDVVIIEDLDRFEQTEIFTKLRELNLLINNSKKVKKEVTFIYAVRDDMFHDKDRTKFFDFIIPVIAVINSSNSNNKLLKIVSDNAYDIADDLIDDISLFVDDMRLLFNITNEYRLYKGLLDEKLSQNKLLSMIVYKNIFPNDFVKLSNREGDLHNVFAGKHTYVLNLQKQLDAEIEVLKQEVKRLSELKITDLKDLRKLYLVHYPKHLPFFQGFYHLDKQYSLEEMADEKLFQMLIDKEIRYKNFVFVQWNGAYSQSDELASISFKLIEKEVDPDRTYAQRADEITKGSESDINALRRKISEKEKKKNGSRHFKIKELITSGALKIDTEDKKKTLLLNVLLRAGHIDEEYLDYISIFYEGSITKGDRDFLLNVKSQVSTDFDFQLSHIEKLVSKIALNDFDQAYILNYNLLDHLLTNNYNAQVNSVLSLLKQGSSRSLSFIDGFLDACVNIEELIKQLTKIWPQFWHVISQQSAYTEERKFKYFDFIISFSDIEDIENMAEGSTFKQLLLSREHILTELSDPVKLEEVIAALNIKFQDVILDGAPETIVDFIYRQNAYQINVTMLRRMMQAKGSYDENIFEKANYQAVKTSNAPSLIEYVDSSLGEYVHMVYLDLDHNSLEPKDSFIQLLNNDSLDMNDREAIIDKTTTTIDRLADSSFAEVDAILLKTFRVEPTWDNVLNNFDYHKDTLTEELIAFLNHLPVAEALSKTLITDSEHSINTENLFITALITSNEITTEAFGWLVKAISKLDEETDFATIIDDTLQILLSNDLIDLTPKNFNSLKNNFEELHICLAEKNAEQFIADLHTYSLDGDDILGLFKSETFDFIQKRAILDITETELIINNTDLLSITGHFAMASPQIFKLPKEILLAVLTKSLTTSERIKLFNMNFNDFQLSEVTAVLQHLPKPYSEISILGRRPILPYGEENNYFVNNLLKLGYISKRRDERKGIRIFTFKNEQS